MENENSGKALASFILGIISVVFIFFGRYAVLGMVLSMIGLVLGIQAIKTHPESSKARAGIILCLVSLGLCILSLFTCMICAGAIARFL